MKYFVITLLLAFPLASNATPGELDVRGCHNGGAGYHCHP